MNTRSSPSMNVLQALARQANMDQYQRLSKPALFQRLKESTNLARLQRARARALKSGEGTASAAASSSSSSAAVGHRSSSGGGGSSAGGRARAARVHAHHNEDEDEDDEAGYYDCNEEAMELAEAAVPSTPSAAAAAAGGRGLRSHHRALPGGGKLSPAEAAAAAAAASAASGKGAGKKKAGASAAGAAAGLNDRDPIFGTPLSPHTFRFTRPNGSCVLYDVESLVDYILATGSFLEPETRLPLTDADLRHLDALARGAGLAKPSVWEARHSVRQGQAYAEARFRRDGLLGLERCAGELVAEMLALVEAEEEEDDEEEETWAERAEMRLVVTLFPLLADLYRQMEAADREWALQCLAHFAEYMRGPPNRRTRDPHGFLRVILNFFHDLRNGQGHF